MKKLFTCIALGCSASMLWAHEPGSVDSSYQPQLSGAPSFSAVQGITLQPDGKALYLGDFTTMGAATLGHIARINENGTIDATFSGTGSGFDNEAYDAVVQADGKIIVTGKFISFNRMTCYHIARLNPDGSFDSTYNFGGGFDGNTYGIALQPDGKAIVTGNFTSYWGASCNHIARLNTDGSLDTTFHTANGFNRASWCVTIQPDSMILVGGQFTNYNGVIRQKLARLYPDGTIDATFQTGSGLGGFGNTFAPVTALSMALEPDGKILVAGRYTSYNGVSCGDFALLHPDGTLDTIDLKAGSGFAGLTTDVEIQPDGKILVSGAFNAYDGTNSPCLARLNMDGTIDNTFKVNNGFDGTVHDLAIQHNSMILAGGEFTNYNSFSGNTIVRLYGNADIQTVLSSSGVYCSGNTLSVPFTTTETFNAGNVFSAQLSDANGSFLTPVTIGTLTGTTGGVIPATIPQNTPSGNAYRIRVVSSNPVMTGPPDDAGLTVDHMDDAVITNDGLKLRTTVSFYSYQWLLDDHIIPGATDSTYTATQNGGYTVVVSDGNGCTDTSAVFNVSDAGVNDVTPVAKQIMVYPNPAADWININAPLKINAAVFTIEGKRVKATAATNRVPVGELAPGIYFLRITNPKDGRLLKVVQFVKQACE